MLCLQTDSDLGCIHCCIRRTVALFDRTAVYIPTVLPLIAQDRIRACIHYAPLSHPDTGHPTNQSQLTGPSEWSVGCGPAPYSIHRPVRPPTPPLHVQCRSPVLVATTGSPIVACRSPPWAIVSRTRTIHGIVHARRQCRKVLVVTVSSVRRYTD